MDKKNFCERIESGEAVRFGRFYSRKHGADYCFYAESAEIYENFDELWNRAKSFVLYGIDYSGKDKSRNRRMGKSPGGDPPTLAYSPEKFNPAIMCGGSIVPNYYDKGQDLIISSNPHSRVTTVDPLTMRPDDKQYC